MNIMPMLRKTRWPLLFAALLGCTTPSQDRAHDGVASDLEQPTTTEKVSASPDCSALACTPDIPTAAELEALTGPTGTWTVVNSRQLPAQTGRNKYYYHVNPLSLLNAVRELKANVALISILGRASTNRVTILLSNFIGYIDRLIDHLGESDESILLAMDERHALIEIAALLDRHTDQTVCMDVDEFSEMVAAAREFIK